MFIVLPLLGAALVVYLAIAQHWSLGKQIFWYGMMIALGAAMPRCTS